MNSIANNLRQHLTPWFNWWLGGWADAWAQLPKPAALQAKPAIFKTLDGRFVSVPDKIASAQGQTQWQEVKHPVFVSGQLINDDDVLLRQLHLPPLSERDIAAAVAMDVHTASPFNASETLYGYSTLRQPNGQIHIEIAITRRSQVERLQSTHPTLALFARGSSRAIPLHDNTPHPQSAWYRSPLTLGLLALLLALVFAWIISPLVLLRAEAIAHESALSKLNTHAAPLMNKREELNTLQQHLENAFTFDQQHPDPLNLLEQLSRELPDNTWITQLNLHKDQLTLEGSSDNAVAIVSLLEKITELQEVRLGASINRDPRNGRENFQILARIQSKPQPPQGATP